MIIRVDTRETELIKLLQHFHSISPLYKGIEIIVETLPLGDIILENKSGIADVIIERKSIRDLSASIKDGRYEEQSYRLNGIDHHNHNIVYLIEGDVTVFNSFNTSISKNTIYSAMVSLNFYKGFSVMRSMNTEETALILLNMAYKIHKGYKEEKQFFFPNAAIGNSPDVSSDDGEIEHTQEQNAKDYCSVVKKVKKDNITIDNIGEIMLCQIPGISSVTALAVIDKFKTITDLIAEMQDSPECLDDISYVTEKGQIRKIAKPAVANIKKYLIC